MRSYYVFKIQNSFIINTVSKLRIDGHVLNLIICKKKFGKNYQKFLVYRKKIKMCAITTYSMLNCRTSLSNKVGNK